MNIKSINSPGSDNTDVPSPTHRTNEFPSKTKVRRTRLKLLFDEFQKEITNLEDKVGILTSENESLRSRNDQLRRQLDESSDLSVKIPRDPTTIGDGKTTSNNEMNSVGDISTIIKLSNKLQEMISVNENITRVNTALRRDLKNLTNERDLHLQDITKLREEKVSSRSPYSYNMVSLKDKVDNYEREIQQWKNAMKRADDYIGELGNELEKYKRTNHNSSGGSGDLIGGNEPTNDLPSSRSSHHGGSSRVSPSNLSTASHHSPLTSSLGGMASNLGGMTNNSAAEALQKLVSKVDTTKNESSTVNEKLDETYSDKSIPPIIELSSNQSGITKTDNIMETQGSPDGVHTSGELFSDPIRFPACVKLLELTKARQSDDSMINARTQPPLSEANKYYNMSSATDVNHNNMFWNNGMASMNSILQHGGPIVHHHSTSNIDERSHKGDVEDDITIVLPSSDHSLTLPSNPNADNNNITRDFLYNNTNNRSFETSLRSRMETENVVSTESHTPRLRMDSEFNNPTDNHLSGTNNGGGGDGLIVVPSSGDYSYYSTNTYSGNHLGSHPGNHPYPPMKRVKVEDVYK